MASNLFTDVLLTISSFKITTLILIPKEQALEQLAYITKSNMSTYIKICSSFYTTIYVLQLQTVKTMNLILLFLYNHISGNIMHKS